MHECFEYGELKLHKAPKETYEKKKNIAQSELLFMTSTCNLDYIKKDAFKKAVGVNLPAQKKKLHGPGK